MWPTKFLTLLLSILLCCILAHTEDEETCTTNHAPDEPPFEIILSPKLIRKYDSGTNVTLSVEADHNNCTQFNIQHRGDKIEEKYEDSPLRPSSTLSTITAPTDDLKDLHAQDKIAYKNKRSPEKNATEKHIKGVNVTKHPSEAANSSENVTVSQDYSTVQKYPPTQDKKGLNFTGCTAPFHDKGNYNWYQVISENGGIPGKMNATILSTNITQILDPCERPLRISELPSEDLHYNFEMFEFEKFYRREETFLRFAGTQAEFVDIHGDFVWSPPGHHRRYYRLEYWKDDTGFYIQVYLDQKCEFSQNPDGLKCFKPQKWCVCGEDGTEICECLPVRGAGDLPPQLLAGLLGSG